RSPRAGYRALAAAADRRPHRASDRHAVAFRLRRHRHRRHRQRFERPHRRPQLPHPRGQGLHLQLEEEDMTAPPSRPMGFLTDTTVCIGCKACEVACKQWNQLPMDNLGLTGFSYDNTGDLGASTWRHVAFVERITDAEGRRPTSLRPFQSNWLMLSDVCKHCVNAGCLEACPTGAIVRTEFGTVFIQPDICNGCGYCLPA